MKLQIVITGDDANQHVVNVDLNPSQPESAMTAVVNALEAARRQCQKMLREEAMV